MIKHAVFDWDGTLADTYPVLYAAYCAAARGLNVPEPLLDDIQKVTGTLQNKNVMQHLFGEKEVEAKKYFYDYIENNHLEKLKTMKGAKDVLDFCRQNGIKSYLLTNKKKKYLDEELKHLGFDGYFEKIVTAGLYEHDKPHPVACEALFDGKIPPHNEIIVIGDGGSDAKAAEVLGATSIIVGNHTQGHYQISELIQAIDTIKQINIKLLRETKCQNKTK